MFWRIRHINFVTGIIVSFLFTVYVAFFTGLFRLGSYPTFAEELSAGMQIFLVLMMSLAVFTVPAFVMHARKMKS